MQPIKTSNAMNPAPAKGIESFPTPVIDDVVIAEVVNAWKGDYQKLEYGTLWKDVSHAPNQGSFPEHKLVFQQPTSEDGQWIKRIWVNDRVNQDSYNYAIKYSAGSQQHPIYIRTYIVPRETYTPLPDGTPDPLFPIALLVDEEATRIEGELDSKYISVTRVYETLPGPEVPTKRYNERGDLETVIVQTVPPFTPPDPDGLLVTGSQVVQEEMGKGVKTTSTVQDHSLLQIKEKREGLLGETITTDDIVDPLTNPDALSQTIVSSSVEQFSATKARKRTTTASGPTSLTQKSKDGKLLGDVTSTQTVVAPNDSPDAISSAILSSDVKQIDSGKAVKTNVVLNSTPTLTGRQNEGGLLGEKTITESIVPAGSQADALSQTILSSSVEAIDIARSKKTTIESIGPTTLASDSLVDSPLGLVKAEIERSIVPIDEQPQSGDGNVLLLKDSITPIDQVKAEREKVVVSNWPLNWGGDYDESLGFAIPYRQSIVKKSDLENSEADRLRGDYKPIDQWKVLTKGIDFGKLDRALKKVWYKVGIDIPIKLPDRLLSVTAYYGQSYAAGGDYDFGQGSFTGSYNRNQSGSSKSSASMNGDIYFEIEQGFNGTISGFEHIFFLGNPGYSAVTTGEEVLRKLNELEKSRGSKTVYKKWPYLRMKTENVILITGGKSESRSKSLSESVSINGFARSQGSGSSFDVNVNASSINIPTALHDKIIIKEEFVGDQIPPNLLVTYGVRPKALEATKVRIDGKEEFAPKFPTGDYLYSSSIDLFKWGYVKVTARTVKITSEYI
jgi:hypothetical protein